MAKRRRRGSGAACKRKRAGKLTWFARWRYHGRVIERVAGSYRSDATDLLAEVDREMHERLRAWGYLE